MKLSPTSPSEILRKESKAIVDDIHNFGLKYVKHKSIMEFIARFYKPRIDNIILHEAKIEDIRDVLFLIKKRVDKLYGMLDTVEQLKESKTDDKLNKKVMELPEFKALSELLG